MVRVNKKETGKTNVSQTRVTRKKFIRKEASKPKSAQSKIRPPPSQPAYFLAAEPLAEEKPSTAFNLNTLARDILRTAGAAAGTHSDSELKPLNHDYFRLVGHYIGKNSSTLDRG
jgi:hypothetical protein